MLLDGIAKVTGAELGADVGGHLLEAPAGGGQLPRDAVHERGVYRERAFLGVACSSARANPDATSAAVYCPWCLGAGPTQERSNWSLSLGAVAPM